MRIILVIICTLLLLSCVDDSNFSVPKTSCSENLGVNTTIAEVKKLYVDEVLQIQEDLIIEGYIISSDRTGNFFSTLHIQETKEQPTEGIQLEVDLRDSHLLYPVGSKVYIKLKGLYIGKSKAVFKIGGVFSTFGNLIIGRLPALKVPEHIFISCNEASTIEPNMITIEALDDSMLNTLVQLQDLEFVEEELELPFAVFKEATERTLVDCLGNKITLLNSGFSDFQDQILPNGNGSVTGVLSKKNNDYQLMIRDLNDIDFSQERCPELIEEFTSTAIFISELSDPNNNAKARFVELYNSSLEPLSLKGWTLRRYTNANTEVSSTINLTGYTINAESTFVIAPNELEFTTVYGFSPDLGVGTNSPADSNGDDTIELVDPFGTVIDIFGVIGEDGSGTNHEFEDGRAVRKIAISKANAIYTFSEWDIYNDTGAAGTINRPQNAPSNYSPGIR